MSGGTSSGGLVMGELLGILGLSRLIGVDSWLAGGASHGGRVGGGFSSLQVGATCGGLVELGEGFPRISRFLQCSKLALAQ